jgi:hypothetical protein
MHSNFITPPDLVESILIIDADQAQIESCALACKDATVPYNVYFYTTDMDDLSWLDKVIQRVDTVLLQQDSDTPVLNHIKYGPDQILKEPADYFAK